MNEKHVKQKGIPKYSVKNQKHTMTNVNRSSYIQKFRNILTKKSFNFFRNSKSGTSTQWAHLQT